jgi:EmrB/QacA subfamily drug resistance transporter
MLNPVAMAIVTNTFTDTAERARVIGLWGGVFGLSIALGPVVGGALVGSAGWRGVFWINIPVGIAAIALTAAFVPESRAGTYRRPDPLGQALIMAALGTLSYAIIEGPGRGWGSAPVTACFAVAAAALAAFCRHELRRAQPLVDLRFFRSIPFAGAAATAIAGMAAFAGFLFLITLYLQDVRGYRPLQAGLFLVPMALVMAASAPLCGRVIARNGTRLALVIAGTGVTAGGALLAFLTPASPPWYVLASCVVLGIGMGWLNAPVTNSAVTGMPRSQAGVASGIASTSRQVGSSLGVAVTGSVLAAGLHGALSGIATGSLGGGFTSAARPGWWIIAALGAVVLALALVTTGQRGRASAQRAAALITAAEQAAVPAVPAPAAGHP